MGEQGYSGTPAGYWDWANSRTPLARLTGAGAGGAAGSVGGGGNLTGSAYDFSGAYGGKPNVPDPVAMAKLASEGNLGNMGSYSKVAEGVNALNYSEMMKQILAGNPNYASNLATSSANISDWLAGNATDTTKARMAQEAAERGVSRGGVLTDADYLRGLGLTAEELQGQGEKARLAMLAGTPRTDLFDVSKMFLSPNDTWNAQLYANLIAASPIPSQRENANLNALTGGVRMGAQTAPGSTAMPNVADLIRKYSQPTAPGQASSYFTVNPNAPPINFGSSFQPGVGIAQNPTNWNYSDTYPANDFGGEFDTVQSGMDYNPGQFEDWELEAMMSPWD